MAETPSTLKREFQNRWDIARTKPGYSGRFWWHLEGIIRKLEALPSNTDPNLREANEALHRKILQFADWMIEDQSKAKAGEPTMPKA